VKQATLIEANCSTCKLGGKEGRKDREGKGREGKERHRRSWMFLFYAIKSNEGETQRKYLENFIAAKVICAGL
jgi:hypothetical protein